MKNKFWIDNSNGYPVMMTTDGKMSWREACKVSWKSCKESQPNYTLYLVLGLTAVFSILTYILHNFIL